jgi:hypothetical protein
MLLRVFVDKGILHHGRREKTAIAFFLLLKVKWQCSVFRSFPVCGLPSQPSSFPWFPHVGTDNSSLRYEVDTGPAIF